MTFYRRAWPWGKRLTWRHSLMHGIYTWTAEESSQQALDLGWFSEDFDTVGLQEDKALLKELQGTA